MSPADMVALVPSAGLWGVVVVAGVRLIRWIVERSDALTEAAIQRLTDDLERCRARNVRLDQIWDTHRKVCPMWTFPTPPDDK